MTRIPPTKASPPHVAPPHAAKPAPQTPPAAPSVEVPVAAAPIVDVANFDLQRGLAVPRSDLKRRQLATCINERGAVGHEMRDGGIASDEDFSATEQSCRQEFPDTGALDAADVPSQARAASWLSANRTAIEAVHDKSWMNENGVRVHDDLGAMAEMFTTDTITNASLHGKNDAWCRTDAVLSAFEVEHQPGVRFHWAEERFEDHGFAGTPDFSSDGFRDPHRTDSRNQVGHFLTAIGLGFDSALPKEVVERVTTMRKLIGAPETMSDDDVVITTIVGHELVADADAGSSALTYLAKAQEQFAAGAAHPEYRDAFRAALFALGNNWRAPNLAAAETELRRIPLNTAQAGNSYQDLRLSLVGFYLGRLVANGVIAKPAGIAEFIQKVIGQR